MGGEPGILDVVTGEKKCQEPKKPFQGTSYLDELLFGVCILNLRAVYFCMSSIIQWLDAGSS